MPIGRADFDGPLSLGYRQKRPRAASRFKSCATGQPVDDPSRLLSVVFFRMGCCASVIELGSSTASEHLVKTRRCGFDSRPETSKPSLVHPSPFSTGRRIGLSLITTWSRVRVPPPAPILAVCKHAGVAQR